MAALHAEFAFRRCLRTTLRAKRIKGIAAFDAKLGLTRIFKPAFRAFHFFFNQELLTQQLEKATARVGQPISKYGQHLQAYGMN